MIRKNFILFSITFIFFRVEGALQEIYKSEGDLNVAVLINNCDRNASNSNNYAPYTKQSLINSAIWTIQRVNFLQTVDAQWKFGLEIYETCTDLQRFQTLFALYQNREKKLILGVISDGKFDEKFNRFNELLEISNRFVSINRNYLLKATVQFLSAIKWVNNITVVAPDDLVLKDFYRYSKIDNFCFKDCYIYKNNCLPNSLFNDTGIFIIFGNKNTIENFSKNYDNSNINDHYFVFVPLDGSVPKELPKNSFVIIPPHQTYSLTPAADFHPNPLLFDIAKPIVSYTQTINNFITKNCNDTNEKISCLLTRFKFINIVHQKHDMSAENMLEFLQIEPLKDLFIYNIFYIENTTTRKNNYFQPSMNTVFTYSIFNDNLTIIDENFYANNTLKKFENLDDIHCIILNNNYGRHNIVFTPLISFQLRDESWVFAVLSISLLGVLFCTSILIFILVSMCRRNILEGNPVLTVALTLTVILMFAAVVPFSLEPNKTTQNSLCETKILCLTLAYSLTFSLVLARCILLATAAKDIGFMSHVAGPVQSFLTLFIFGVQAALSLHIIGNCAEFFKGCSLIFLMLYNIMLLLLLLCLTPLIYHSQRNYREGKYFCIAIGITTCIWSVWIPCYAILDDKWHEAVLCFGLVASAAAFLGAIFIPRTYLMTIAAARDKITNALPSLATASSVMDIYRANTQPVYDCINVAAINAATVARAGMTGQIQQPDLYSCPALPEDEDFDFRCETPPIGSDKITRF